jgi:hypothetical protein
MTRRIAAVLAVALAFAGPAALRSSGAVPGIPAFYIDYRPDCTFTMSVDPGTQITPAAPGPTLPPGTYQLLISMSNPSSGYACVTPSFTFTGPGVSARTVFPGAALDEDTVVTLQPSGTYSAQDDNAPAATRRVFTTGASGSSSALLGPGLPSTAKPGTTSSDIVGSAIPRYRGKLLATVTARGKATLTRGGRVVGSLEAGRYDIAVQDASARAGFFVRRGSGKAITVTSLAFVGKRTKRISLTAGKWAFFSKPGKPVRFTVVA